VTPSHVGTFDPGDLRERALAKGGLKEGSRSPENAWRRNPATEPGRTGSSQAKAVCRHSQQTRPR